MSGQIRYEQWLSYHMSLIELLCFAALFAVVYLFTGSASFLGAAVLTALLGMKHLKLSREPEEESQQDDGQVSPESALSD